MQTVQNILYRVAGTSGKNDKIAILKEELPKNPLLQRVAKYALDQGRTYNVTALSSHRLPGWEPFNETAAIFTMLDYLAGKRGASQEDIDNLSRECRTDAARDIVHRIINKDLRIGATASSFNKAMPGLIYEVPYNRYSSFSKLDPEKLEGEDLIIQLKNDGRFSYMQDPEVTDQPFCTRQGNVHHLHGFLEDHFEWVRALQDNIECLVRMEGELLVIDGKGGFLDRITGNGLIEKFILGDKAVKGLGEKLRYIVWGFVTDDEYEARISNVPYSIVWKNILEAYDKYGEKNQIIKPTWSKNVPDYDAAMDFYRKIRAIKTPNGKQLEGAMLKVANKLVWKDNSSGNLHGFKMKAEATAEFEIIDAYYGDPGKKWENYLGGLLVATSDRKIITNIGGGFTDDERKLGVDWWRGKKGKIITGKFTGVVTDKSSRETYCLEHSRMPNMGGEMVETRFSEKDEADTYEYCLEQLKVA